MSRGDEDESRVISVFGSLSLSVPGAVGQSRLYVNVLLLLLLLKLICRYAYQTLRPNDRGELSQ